MPRSISKEEAKKLGLRPIGKKHPLRVAIENLATGEITHITRAEFTWKKKTPCFFILQIEKATGKKFTIAETLNRMGWVVERVG